MEIDGLKTGLFLYLRKKKDQFWLKLKEKEAMYFT